MVEKCKANDLAFITMIFGTLSPHHSAYIEQYSNSILSPEEMFSNILDLGNSIVTNRSILLQFSGNQHILGTGMNAFLQLFRNRNASALSKAPNRYIPSIFLDAQSSYSIINSQIDLSNGNSIPYLSNVDLSQVYRI